jgi:putative tryptophan/tyrosine transport system substrate-binding protein
MRSLSLLFLPRERRSRISGRSWPVGYPCATTAPVSEQLGALAVRYSMPAVHQSRAFAVAGGLMGYGGSVKESHRQSGVYVGRILEGERPADLPIQQVTKVEFVLNLRSARGLGLSPSLSFIARADEVIE